MIKRGAGTSCQRLLPHLLLAALVGLALAEPLAQAADAAHPVTATPPLVAVPATPVSKNVQQRMRACNATADARKLQASARETFIKGCMAAHHRRAGSRAGSEPKPNP
ncbi:MAG TPA: PsiF family protein [Steroidobacteraceae bacterium]|nr:PsiF family protein [Steroidobacteraceae bacterium]